MTAETVQEILWTDSAKITFQNIIAWLRQEWSEKEVDKFINRTEELLALLKRYPEMCRLSIKRKNVRISIIDKHTKLVYHYNQRKRQIVILLFWGMKQNPANFKY